MQENKRSSDLVCDCDFEKRIGGGSNYSEESFGCFKIERITLEDGMGASFGGIRSGRYVSIHSRDVCSLSLFEESELIKALGREISSFGSGEGRVLAVGIGNPEFTADSLGQKFIERIEVREGGRLCALRADVAERTGIETSEIVASVCAALKPDLVVVVDSLVTKSDKRLGKTIQLSDAGISPGSGLGASKKEINRDTVGSPVLAIGAATVIDADLMLADRLARFGDEAILQELTGGLLLTPHSVDFTVERLAYILARAVGSAFE